MGSLSTGATFAFWLFYTILILVAYHKLFAVVYFDTAKGLLREFIIAAIAGIILTGISLSKPLVGIVVIIIVALIGIGKAQSGGGKVVIVILAIVACVIVGIVGRNVQKNMETDDNTESSEINETIDTEREEEKIYSQEEEQQIEKKLLKIDSYHPYADDAATLADKLSAKWDIVYLEEYDGYGFSDGSLIIQDSEIQEAVLKINIIAEYSEELTISVLEINTDMTLEEADTMLVENCGAVNVSYPDDNAWRYAYGVFDITLYGAGEKGINIVVKPYYEEEMQAEIAESEEMGEVHLEYILTNYYYETAENLATHFESLGYNIDTFGNDEYMEYSIDGGAVSWVDGIEGIDVYMNYIGTTNFSLYGLNCNMTYEQASNHLKQIDALDLGYNEEVGGYQFIVDEIYSLYVFPADDKIVVSMQTF